MRRLVRKIDWSRVGEVASVVTGWTCAYLTIAFVRGMIGLDPWWLP
jgi:hypothetical protein